MTTPHRTRNAQISAFYTAHATHLRNSVHAAARAPEPVIEDACQTAWIILMRRPDITLNERGLNWLTTVAIHEAWRLNSTAHEIPAGSFQDTGIAHPDELPEPAHPDGVGGNRDPA